MTRRVPFGRRMRNAHFGFAPSYTPINHGSFGGYPLLVQQRQNELQAQGAARPCPFIVYDLPDLIDEARTAVAPLLGVPVDEVVLIPNATTGINTVLRNLKFEEGDVIVHFETIYPACEKTIASIGELGPLTARGVPLEYPIEDEEIVKRFKEKVGKLRDEGCNVKVAMFDTIQTFPGVVMPWEELVAACKELGVLSLIDGAHGIGHIDLTHLGAVDPDFFVSNCHKWLFTPRSCAVFRVPIRNQHLIRTCLPTSHGYNYLSEPPAPGGKSPFVLLFQFVATIDYTPYCCLPAALAFRKDVCGGEAEIRKYSWDLAKRGGIRAAEILGTQILETKRGTCFTNVKLPLTFKPIEQPKKLGDFGIDEVTKIASWLNLTALKEFDTYLQIGFHAGFLWVRLSGQIYLELKDFEWVGFKLKELCTRLVDDKK